MYVYLPPRTTNYFPPQIPYLAGLRGLGDYAADLATYKHAMALYETDYKKWAAEKKKYDVAMAAYNTTVASMNASYGSTVGAYQRAKADWDLSFSNSKRVNTTRSMTIAKSYGLSLPQSYYDNGACLSKADHDAFVRQCSTVKGLGSSDPNCGMSALPVCQFGPKPMPPAAPKYPKAPTLRAQPVAPAAPAAPPVVTKPSGDGSGWTTKPPSVPVPVSLPTPQGPEETSPPAVVDEPKQANILMNGLIIVAVLGGGYLVYRTLRKPKAQAA